MHVLPFTALLAAVGLASASLIDSQVNQFYALAQSRMDEHTFEHPLIEAGVELCKNGAVVQDDEALKQAPYGLGDLLTPLVSNTKHILLTAAPGAGMAHLVYLLESVTGLAVESRDAWASRQDLTLSDFTHAYSEECGWSEQCADVRRSGAGDLIITETTFPFNVHGDSDKSVADKLKEYSSFTTANLVVLLVRNAIDAMILQDVGVDEADSFMYAWAHHADFWVLRESTTPVLIVRFEDLMQYPEHTLGRILQAAGLWYAPNIAKTISESEIALAADKWRTAVSEASSSDSIPSSKLSIKSELHVLNAYPFIDYLLKGQSPSAYISRIFSAARSMRATMGRLGYGYWRHVWDSLTIDQMPQLHQLTICTLFGMSDIITPFRLLWAGVDAKVVRNVQFLAISTQASTYVPVFINKVASSTSVAEFPHSPLFAKEWLEADGPLQLVLFPVVPRAGSTWMRSMIEVASGLATSSVYAEARGLVDPRTHVSTQSCGSSKDCTYVRLSQNRDPVIAKTHYPFKTNGDCDDAVNGPFARCSFNYTAVMTSVRNPIESFISWRRSVGHALHFIDV